MKYKPSKQNVLADALSRRPDYEHAHVTTLSSPIGDLIHMAYPRNSQCVTLFRALGCDEYTDSDTSLSTRLRASLHRHSINNGLLSCRTDVTGASRIDAPHNENLKYRILVEAHDNAFSG